MDTCEDEDQPTFLWSMPTYRRVEPRPTDHAGALIIMVGVPLGVFAGIANWSVADGLATFAGCMAAGMVVAGVGKWVTDRRDKSR